MGEKRWQRVVKWCIILFLALFLIPHFWAGLASGFGGQEQYLPAYVEALAAETIFALFFVFVLRKKMRVPTGKELLYWALLIIVLILVDSNWTTIWYRGATTVSSSTVISFDGASIISNGKTLVDNDAVFNTCDETGNPISSTRLCTNKNRIRFSSVVASPDKINFGINIRSDVATDDTVVGIFRRSINRVDILTNYYTGNEFISFSPSGMNFAYKGDCFEGLCALFIKSSETLASKASLRNPLVDDPAQNITFVRWISDNEIEYKLGSELKRFSF